LRNLLPCAVHKREGGSAFEHAHGTGAEAAGPAAPQFGSDMIVYRQAAAGAPREPLARIAPAHSPTPSWIHDFPVTPNWAVVPETPVYYNLKAPPGPPCRARARPADPLPQTLPGAARNDRRAAAGRRRWWAARSTSCSTGCRSAARACTWCRSRAAPCACLTRPPTSPFTTSTHLRLPTGAACASVRAQARRPSSCAGQRPCRQHSGDRLT